MSKPVICLDAGHGGKDSGALGPNGEKESDVALSVVMLLGALLVGLVEVVYTRRTDEFVELSRRATLANDAGAHAFLSIHCNSGEPGKGEGFEIFTSPGQTMSDELATDVFTSYGEMFPEKHRRMDLADGDPDKEAAFTVLTRTHMRAVLIELEFIHTAAGAAWLTQRGNQVLCAKAIADAVKRHFGISDGNLTDLTDLTDLDIKARIRAKALEIGELINRIS